MADITNNPHNPNPASDKESTGSNPPDSISPLAKEEGPPITEGPSPVESKDVPSIPPTPLPNFDSDLPESEKPASLPIKTSAATPAKLNKLFIDPTKETPEVDKPAPNPVYRISSAEPDLPNNYPLPALADEASPEEETGSSWQTTWAIIREVGETIILTLIIFFVIQLFVRNFRVVGTSMVGNLHDGQYLIIDKVSYHPFIRDFVGIGGPNRGDVIVFKPPRNPNDDYVKRVIGLPGEKVQVIQGQVFINDEPLPEPFQPTSGTYSMSEPVIVADDQVFVLGDNRNNSNDSHNWGPLPMENIVGRAWVSYWPPDQWGTIPNDAPTEEATLWHFVGQIIPAANAHNE